MSVIYRGPSLLDGKPIVVIATVTDSNSKTGAMVQTYIIRSDMAPTEANKTGEDYSICGNCPHRGIPSSDPNRKTAERRTCYVSFATGLSVVWKAFSRGVYPDVSGHAAIAAIGKGRKVRLGTYGDPSAVPSYVWESLLSLATGRTGYSHQANVAGADFRPDLVMQSVDSLDEAKAAWQAGRRTFRVVASTTDIVKGREILCPASKEAGHRTTCSDCCCAAAMRCGQRALPFRCTALAPPTGRSPYRTLVEIRLQALPSRLDWCGQRTMVRGLLPGRPLVPHSMTHGESIPCSVSLPA